MMSDNVVGLFGDVPSDVTEAQRKKISEYQQEILNRFYTGDVVGMAFVLVHEDQSYTRGSTGFYTTSMVGHLELLKKEVLDHLADVDDES